MVRPKKGEKGCAEANAKWRTTMYEQHGGPSGVRAFMQSIGHKGGSAFTTKLKGFAANPELAKRAGAIGGKKSRRGPSKNKKEK